MPRALSGPATSILDRPPFGKLGPGHDAAWVSSARLEAPSMAGTDHRRRASSGGPAIILVEPQLGENIGTAARAMFNCGLTDLRLVKPRDGWPNDKAGAAASGADIVLDKAQLFDTRRGGDRRSAPRLRHHGARPLHGEARGDAAPARRREMRRFVAAGEACGILFGPERTGLRQRPCRARRTVLSVPLNPAFSSLNLAQAVLLVGYEWFAAGEAAPAELLPSGASAPGHQGGAAGFLRRISRRSSTAAASCATRRSGRAWCATCATSSSAPN